MPVPHLNVQKSCRQCGSSFEITSGDLAFYEKVSPVFGGKKYGIPPPTFCPDCRQQRRLALCNERHFYPATCRLCKKETITEHPPHRGRTIYCRTCWHGDDWDPLAYGRDVDFSRPFCDQVRDLREVVPVMNLLTEGTNVNSDYIHYAGFAKNCYLIMHADFCEDCCYGYGFKKDTSCMDGFYNLRCELCCDCVDVQDSYALKGCQDCIHCSSSAFLRDCIGCKHCFLCTGQRDKEFCFENKQLNKEDYHARLKQIDLGSTEQYQQCRERREIMEMKHTFKEFTGHNLQKCSGDHLHNCKDTHASFDCEDVEGGKYLYQVVIGAKNIYDIYQYGLNLQESYECSIAGNDSYHVLFTHNAHINCSDVYYCWFIQSSQHCFGCVNVHHKKYCILNKQYAKEEYEQLVPKIIDHMRGTGEWGELFPTAHAPFGYNKTSAQMYYPLTRDAAEQKGWKWDDYEHPPPDVEKIISAEQIPDNIDDIPDDILNWAIRCEATGRPFKIQPLELRLLRKMRVPIPRRHPDQRHFDRFALRNPRTLFMRKCDKCQKDIQTTYAPNRPETVYCEQCYLQTVY